MGPDGAGQLLRVRKTAGIGPGGSGGGVGGGGGCWDGT